MVKSSTTATVSICLPRAELDHVDHLAAQAQLSRSRLIRHLINAATGAKPATVETKGVAR